MLSEPTYLAARMVAPAIEAHFAEQRQLATTRQRAHLAPAPEGVVVEAMIDVAFWASLRREEGHPPKISLALLPAAEAPQPPLVLGHPKRLTPPNLIKLAPAVEQPGIHLGVWYDADGLHVWGTVTELPPLCLVLEVIEPGLLVVKHPRVDGFGKFLNVAILRGDQLQVVDGRNTGVADCQSLRRFLPGTHAGDGTDEVLVELAAAMRAHGRGGLVLVVPNGSEQWPRSIVQPMSYPVVPPYAVVSEVLAQQPQGPDWAQDLRHAIGYIGGFTAVDGATIISEDYRLLGFGAKVARAEGRAPVEEMMITEPVLGSEARRVHPAQNGGTRHLAAAQFVHDQRDALALVASQDGFFTVFAWSPKWQMVHAHRIDVLLL